MSTQGAGIDFREVQSPLRPDVEDLDHGAQQASGPNFDFNPDGPVPEGTVPLDPHAVKLPLKAIGNMAADATGFTGWRFSEEELDAFAGAMEELGLRLPKVANMIIVCGGIVAIKGMGYVAWRRAGRPGPNDGREHHGESEIAA